MNIEDQKLIPKSEIRNPKSEEQGRFFRTDRVRFSFLGILSDFGLRISALLALSLCASSALGQGTNNNSGTSFESFNIISQRNIFDPNRRGGYTRRPTANRPRVEYISLVGTMSYTKGKFAFFDSSSSQYRKVLEPGGDIAGYTVKEITPKAITLAMNDKEWTMSVGGQLRNENQSGWKFSTEKDKDLPSNLESNNQSASAPDTSPPLGSNPQQSEILKRLMQQRAQEDQQ